MQIEKDGETIEVFTPEEVQAQQAQAIEAATAPLKTELEKAKEDLSKASDKDYNFSNLRTRVEQAEEKIKAAKEDALKEFEITQTTKTADSLIKNGAFSSGGAAPVMPPRPDPSKPPLSGNQINFLRTYAGMSDEELNHSALKVQRLPEGLKVPFTQG